MNNTYGYARVSTRDQNEQRQIYALRTLGVLGRIPAGFALPPPNGKTARCSIYALYISKRKINSRLQVAEQHAFLQLAFQPSLGAFLCQKHRSNQNSA